MAHGVQNRHRLKCLRSLIRRDRTDDVGKRGGRETQNVKRSASEASGEIGPTSPIQIYQKTVVFVFSTLVADKNIVEFLYRDV